MIANSNFTNADKVAAKRKQIARMRKQSIERNKRAEESAAAWLLAHSDAGIVDYATAKLRIWNYGK